jgi:DNA-binding IclR family transcriptional regulator
MNEASAEEPGAGRASGAETARRTVRLLAALAAHQPIKLDALGAAVGLSKSTTYRLMRVLQEEDYAERLAGGGYRIGPAFVGLTTLAMPQTQLFESAGPVMRELADATGETATLHRRAGDLRVLVFGVESEVHALRQVTRIGDTSDLVRGCSGNAILVQLDGATVDAVIERSELDAAERGQLLAQLAEIVDRGFSESDGVNHPGVSGIAVPIRSTGPGPRAMSLAVSGPTHRWTRERSRLFVGRLADAAERLSKQFAAASA